MNVYELILKRRSIRRFQSKSISIDTLNRLVNAARLAPSAANLQPLEYIIVDDPELKDRVFTTLKWAGYIAPEGNPPAGEEPVAYLVVALNTDIKATAADKDVGAACENIILAALSEGIGSCWIESIDRPNLKAILGLPDKLSINSVIALGYPNEQPLVEEMSQPEGSVKYWKDESGRLHVPKRRLVDILYRNGYVKPKLKESQWVVAWKGSVEEEAYLVKGFLENNGISCVLEEMKFREVPVNFSSLSKLQIMVAQEKLAEAQRLIQERSSQVECPACGALNPEGDLICKYCGQDLENDADE
jgi:nitroreductase